MAAKLEKLYPPYTGDKPFIFLCFDAADESAVKPLLERLWVRGCRIWYSTTLSMSVEEERRVQERMEKAGLVIVYASRSFLKSTAKSRMMYLQSRNIPIISVDGDQVDNLAAGYREGTVHIDVKGGFRESAESALITSEGFSQAFIGQRQTVKKNTGLKALLGILAALTLTALVVFTLILTGVIHPEKAKTPDEITELTLTALPDSPEELEVYPNLQKIIIPQSEGGKAAPFMDMYEIVLSKEG